MSTEFTWGDLMQSWGRVKGASRATFGLMKGAAWLGKKALSSPQGGGTVSIDNLPIQSLHPVALCSGSRIKHTSRSQRT